MNIKKMTNTIKETKFNLPGKVVKDEMIKIMLIAFSMLIFFIFIL